MTALDRPALVHAPPTGRLRALGDAPVALLTGLLCALAGLAAMAASQDGHLSPGNLVKIASTDPLADYVRQSDPRFPFVTPAQHYDGSYYYAIARDPFLTGRAHTLLDEAAYRYGHPLHGWLADVLGLGQARAIPMALMVLGLLGLAVAGWSVSLLSVAFGRTPWGGLVVAASPGLLYAGTVDTTETVGAALVALLLLAWVRGAHGWAILASVAVCLDKEPYVVLPLALGAWELLEARRARSWPPQVAVRAAAVIAGPAALGAWDLYVHSRLHLWPWQAQSGNLTTPLTGWATTFRLAHVLAYGSFDQAQIGAVTPPVLLATAVLVLLAVAVALRLRTVLALPMIALAAVLSAQDWPTLLYPHELFRTPSIAALLAVAVLLTQPRRRQVAEPPTGPEAATSR